MAKNDTVQLVHTNGTTVTVNKDKVDTLTRMGFSKPSTRSSSKSGDSK